ncbi:glycosyltransferase [Desulfovibrio desulfuricans]|jgi:Glycosyltransferase involved in LPS biosynthesis|uniref:Glycosyltransferase 2-like domain-containing protein n=1 Tax=uncultured Desulfovibrio sp. TaxID=167968 RepID=A0A212KBE7_9BACT|nr:glycosyltransferase [Desulfovibrio desulfuricans]MBD8897035.1 glycosyltransferase [Desulfovibrio desulfuricans]MCB6542817.1 glycosyltransferase [Desulfovibrio desulfuricans]MCB6553779.1 glycosyltransferase [Desulfovibrio desulfuricans]MCB6564876.1 glycosyltransferase [Desulfovibrio desulfuricans]MCB7346901.1 glycosyltransferase [Desulfovibrio desulfuricans]
MLKSVAPIAVFAFNRAGNLTQTLAALAANQLADQSHLTIFCDGPRNDVERSKTDTVRAVARAAKGFASLRVVERENNLGCAGSIIDGLQQMFAEHERVIVIEDDILCSPDTLTFLNDGLAKYENHKTVWNISAWSPPAAIFPVHSDYPYDVYVVPRFNCWGWGSWRDRFALIDWNVSDYAMFSQCQALQRAFNRGGVDLTSMLNEQMCGELDTWDIRMDYARFKYGCVGVNPVRSYTTNIGIGSGTHTTNFTTRFDNDITLAKSPDQVRWIDHIFVDAEMLRNFVHIYEDSNPARRSLRNALQKCHLLPLAQKIKRVLGC